jgi:predicted NBD/HSP70 family sugar kinase
VTAHATALSDRLAADAGREPTEHAVLEAILEGAPITRPEVARRTGLSRPTVAVAVDRLERAGLVRAVGARDGRRGRKPMAYDVSRRAGFVLAVDIGGTNMRVAASDLRGELLHEWRDRTEKSGARALARQLVEIVEAAERAGRATHERPLAIGISTPGVVDQGSRRVTSLAYNLTPDGGFDPVASLGDRLRVPVLLENNVNLAAVGESGYGLARGLSTFAYVSIGAGVGLGLVIGGEVVRGARGAAGEIGYMPFGTDPFDERHRLHGGLEDEVGAAGILAAVRARDWKSHPAPASAQELFERFTGGDATAAELVDALANKLGLAIATVCSIVDPELVVLGGGIGANPALLAPVRAAVARLLPLPVRIETSSLGASSSLYGALAMALRSARAQLLSPAARAG